MSLEVRGGVGGHGHPKDGGTIGVLFADDGGGGVAGSCFSTAKTAVWTSCTAIFGSWLKSKNTEMLALPWVHSGLDVLDALYPQNRILDHIRHVGFHDDRRGVGQGDGNIDHRKGHVGHLGKAHAVKTEEPEENKPEHEHPGENGVLDGNIG
jgi:hypothetical protein